MPFPALSAATELDIVDNKYAAKNYFSLYDLVRATIAGKLA
jgi:hypothetical protein